MSCFHMLSDFQAIPRYSITDIAGHKISVTKSLHCRVMEFTHGHVRPGLLFRN